jgi:hypothetical protein
VSHFFVNDVLLKKQLIDSVDGDGSVESIVDRIVLDVRTFHITSKMEVNWITTELESLTNISELDVLDPSSNLTLTISKHDMCSILHRF